MAANDARVVVVGSYVQDHAWVVDQFPAPGETRRALGFSSGPGGKGFNQAVACRRQGVATAFLGALGDVPGARAEHDGDLRRAAAQLPRDRTRGGGDSRGGGVAASRHTSIPAIAAEVNAARLPAIMARSPSRAMSPRRSGARPPIPPIWIAIEEKLAKPSSA